MILSGVNAYICYYPFEEENSTPNAYAHYNCKVIQYKSVKPSESIVVIPEVSTSLFSSFEGAKKYIWWLSVDNYFNPHKVDTFKGKLGHITAVLRKRRMSIRSMTKYGHLVQSDYAKNFLFKRGISSYMLSDYLNKAHLEGKFVNKKRQSVIAYNPKKGIAYTKKLMENCPEFSFVPIQNMTPDEVNNLLGSVKVYIDFGEHPGKDRFPREAAMAGCCIVTGKQGSAGNDIDIAIPRKYKIDERESDFIKSFKTIINSIFIDLDGSQKEFEIYRKKIQEEPADFKRDVELFSERVKNA